MAVKHLNLTPLERVLTDLEDQVRLMREHVAAGNCENYEAYRYAVGKLEGLESGRILISDLLAQGDED